MVSTPLAITETNPDYSEMIYKMKAGGHILMIRHALAPGSGDPANFKIGDCSTYGNLDGRGREQAKSIQIKSACCCRRSA